MFALLLGVVVCSSAPSTEDDVREALKGGRLTANEASSLEKRLESDPGDLEARTKLLGYYFLRSNRSPADRKTRQGHVLWVIKNRPETQIAGSPYASLDPMLDGEAFYDARRLWLQHAKEKAADSAVLGNAAAFLLLHDRSSSERLLLEAVQLEPSRADWYQRLAELSSLGAVLGEEPQAKRERAAKALAYHEQALGLLDAEARLAELASASKAAFDAGEHEKARSWAGELVAGAPGPGHWNHGNALHHGHLILGRLALLAGDVEAARRHLLEAGRTPGSPQLDSFGPNMTLAKELLLKGGEQAAVLQYFELCGRFWKSGSERLKVWAEAVRNGSVPDFGANLAY